MLYTQCIMVFLLHENEVGWSKVGRVHLETYTLVKLTLLFFVVLTLKYVQKRNSTSKSTLQHHFRETRSQVPNANMALCIASIQFFWLKINQNDVYYDHKHFTIKLAENQIFSRILVSVVLAFTGFDHPPPHPFPQNRQSSYGPENVVYFF